MLAFGIYTGLLDPEFHYYCISFYFCSIYFYFIFYLIYHYGTSELEQEMSGYIGVSKRFRKVIMVYTDV